MDDTTAHTSLYEVGGGSLPCGPPSSKIRAVCFAPASAYNDVLFLAKSLPAISYTAPPPPVWLLPPAAPPLPPAWAEICLFPLCTLRLSEGI